MPRKYTYQSNQTETLTLAEDYAYASSQSGEKYTYFYHFNAEHEEDEYIVAIPDPLRRGYDFIDWYNENGNYTVINSGNYVARYRSQNHLQIMVDYYFTDNTSPAPSSTAMLENASYEDLMGKMPSSVVLPTRTNNEDGQNLDNYVPRLMCGLDDNGQPVYGSEWTYNGNRLAWIQSGVLYYYACEELVEMAYQYGYAEKVDSNGDEIHYSDMPEGWRNLDWKIDETTGYIISSLPVCYVAKDFVISVKYYMQDLKEATDEVATYTENTDATAYITDAKNYKISLSQEYPEYIKNFDGFSLSAKSAQTIESEVLAPDEHGEYSVSLYYDRNEYTVHFAGLQEGKADLKLKYGESLNKISWSDIHESGKTATGYTFYRYRIYLQYQNDRDELKHHIYGTTSETSTATMPAHNLMAEPIFELGPAKYTVQIWVESPDAYTTESDDNYDRDAIYEGYATAGNIINITDSTIEQQIKNAFNQAHMVVVATQRNVNNPTETTSHFEYEYFTYQGVNKIQRNGTVYNSLDSSTTSTAGKLISSDNGETTYTIAQDGSTVINVYYTRNWYTLAFRASSVYSEATTNTRLPFSNELYTDNKNKTFWSSKYNRYVSNNNSTYKEFSILGLDFSDYYKVSTDLYTSGLRWNSNIYTTNTSPKSTAVLIAKYESNIKVQWETLSALQPTNTLFIFGNWGTNYYSGYNYAATVGGIPKTIGASYKKLGAELIMKPDEGAKMDNNGLISDSNLTDGYAYGAVHNLVACYSYEAGYPDRQNIKVYIPKNGGNKIDKILEGVNRYPLSHVEDKSSIYSEVLYDGPDSRYSYSVHLRTNQQDTPAVEVPGMHCIYGISSKQSTKMNKKYGQTGEPAYAYDGDIYLFYDYTPYNIKYQLNGANYTGAMSDGISYTEIMDEAHNPTGLVTYREATRDLTQDEASDYILERSNISYESSYQNGKEYIFAGWYTTPNFMENTKVDTDSNGNITPEAMHKITSNLEGTEEDGSVTLYAKWEEPEYSVTFNIRGGQFNTSSVDWNNYVAKLRNHSYTVEQSGVSADGTISVTVSGIKEDTLLSELNPPTPVGNGTDFLGWREEEAGVESTDDFVFAANYATKDYVLKAKFTSEIGYRVRHLIDESSYKKSGFTGLSSITWNGRVYYIYEESAIKSIAVPEGEQYSVTESAISIVGTSPVDSTKKVVLLADKSTKSGILGHTNDTANRIILNQTNENNYIDFIYSTFSDDIEYTVRYESEDDDGNVITILEEEKRAVKVAGSATIQVSARSIPGYQPEVWLKTLVLSRDASSMIVTFKYFPNITTAAYRINYFVMDADGRYNANSEVSLYFTDKRAVGSFIKAEEYSTDYAKYITHNSAEVKYEGQIIADNDKSMVVEALRQRLVGHEFDKDASPDIYKVIESSTNDDHSSVISTTNILDIYMKNASYTLTYDLNVPSRQLAASWDEIANAQNRKTTYGFEVKDGAEQLIALGEAPNQHTRVYDAYQIHMTYPKLLGANDVTDSKYEWNYVVPSTNPTCFAYNFAGWSTNPRENYKNTASLLTTEQIAALYYNQNPLVEDVTLYAIWKPAYTITYHLRGGVWQEGESDAYQVFEVAEDQQTIVQHIYDINSTAEPAAPVYYESGDTTTATHSFMGWSIQEPGSSEWYVNENSNFIKLETFNNYQFNFTGLLTYFSEENSNIDLYAVWDPDVNSTSISVFQLEDKTQPIQGARIKLEKLSASRDYISDAQGKVTGITYKINGKTYESLTSEDLSGAEIDSSFTPRTFQTKEDGRTDYMYLNSGFYKITQGAYTNGENRKAYEQTLYVYLPYGELGNLLLPKKSSDQTTSEILGSTVKKTEDEEIYYRTDTDNSRLHIYVGNKEKWNIVVDASGIHDLSYDGGQRIWNPQTGRYDVDETYPWHWNGVGQMGASFAVENHSTDPIYVRGTLITTYDADALDILSDTASVTEENGYYRIPEGVTARFLLQGHQITKYTMPTGTMIDYGAIYLRFYEEANDTKQIQRSTEDEIHLRAQISPTGFEHVYAATISQTELTFTFSEQLIWNPQTLKYEQLEDGWNQDTLTTTIRNYSDLPLTMTPSFNGEGSSYFRISPFTTTIFAAANTNRQGNTTYASSTIQISSIPTSQLTTEQKERLRGLTGTQSVQAVMGLESSTYGHISKSNIPTNDGRTTGVSDNEIWTMP